MLDMMSHLYRSEDILIFHEEKKCTIHPIRIRSGISRDDIEKFLITLSDKKPSWTRRSRFKVFPLFNHIEIEGSMGDVWGSEVIHYR